MLAPLLPAPREDTVPSRTNEMLVCGPVCCNRRLPVPLTDEPLMGQHDEGQNL